MNKKYIIFSGCSYAFRGSIIDTHYEKKMQTEVEIINLGTNSAGNEFIVETTMIVIQNLLENNVNPKDILVVNNFTQIYRPIVKLPIEYFKTANELIEKHATDVRKIFDIEYKSIGSFIKFKNQIYSFSSSLAFLTNELKSWQKYQSETHCNTKIISQHFETYLSSIVILQSFLKKHNLSGIHYLMNNVFDGWDENFNHIYIKKEGPKVPSTKGTLHISDISDYTKVLWDTIDFDMFIFYSTEENKYGGMDEYMLDKFCDREYYQDTPTNNWYFGIHPTHVVYENFRREFMMDKILKWYND